MIALISIAGAIVAWRVTVALGDAGSSDVRGVLAIVEDATVGTQAAALVFGDQVSFASFKSKEAVADELGRVAEFDLQATALKAAARRAREFIPQSYITRDERFNEARAYAQIREQMANKKDLQPQPHFDAADLARGKATWLLFDLVWLAFGVLCLTLADALQSALRQLFLIAGAGLFGIGVLFVIAVELASLAK
jgi:hypothetical protein